MTDRPETSANPADAVNARAPATDSPDDGIDPHPSGRLDNQQGPDVPSPASEARGQAPDANPELVNALSDNDHSPDVTDPAPEPLSTRPADQGQPAETSEPAGDITRAGTDNPAAGRPDITERYPDDYVSSPDPPEVERPHERPERWADNINPDKDGPGRDNNCGECARAVDDTWQGQPAIAAALADPDGAELTSRMTEWAGEAPVPASMSEIEQRLHDLGPGSSAVVGFDKHDENEPGHWFNAVNDAGAIKAVDGQSGLSETWPPSEDGLGFDESDMRNSDAIFFTADGRVVRQ